MKLTAFCHICTIPSKYVAKLKIKASVFLLLVYTTIRASYVYSNIKIL